MKKHLVLVSAIMFAAAGFILAGEGHGKEMKCKMGAAEDGKKCMHEICCMDGVEMAVEKTADGVKIVFTSKDKEKAKKIQENAEAMLVCKKEGGMKGKCPMAGKMDKKCPMASKMAKDNGANEETVTCPVMGTTFPKSKAFAVKEYKGKKYYLCCAHCVSEFDKDPAKYAK